MASGIGVGYGSVFPGGFNSVTIRGVPIVQSHPGRVFWVSNSTTTPLDGQLGGADGNGQGTFNKPFATLNYAVTQCIANRGDVIFIKPNHAETIATASAITLGVAGVAVIGLGTGSSRPTFTWSAAASTINVTANNISLQNLLCISTMATPFTTTAFTVLTTVVAKDFIIDNCEFRDSATTTGFLGIVTQGGTTAAAMDGFTFSNNTYTRLLATVTNVVPAVVVTAAHSRLTFVGNYITQTTANNNVALLVDFGANSQTGLRVSGNRTASLNTGTTAGELFSGGSTGSSGLVSDNYSGHLASSGLLAPTGTKLKFIQNFCHITGAADKSALINPAAV